MLIITIIIIIIVLIVLIVLIILIILFFLLFLLLISQGWGGGVHRGGWMGITMGVETDRFKLASLLPAGWWFATANQPFISFGGVGGQDWAGYQAVCLFGQWLFAK